MVRIDLQEKRVMTTKKKNNLRFRRSFSTNHNQAHPKINQRLQKSFHLWHNLFDTSLVDTVNQKFICILILYIFSQQ